MLMHTDSNLSVNIGASVLVRFMKYRDKSHFGIASHIFKPSQPSSCNTERMIEERL